MLSSSFIFTADGLNYTTINHCRLIFMSMMQVVVVPVQRLGNKDCQCYHQLTADLAGTTTNQSTVSFWISSTKFFSQSQNFTHQNAPYIAKALHKEIQAFSMPNDNNNGQHKNGA